MRDQISFGGTGTVDSEILRAENRVTETFYLDALPINHQGGAILRDWQPERSETANLDAAKFAYRTPKRPQAR